MMKIDIGIRDRDRKEIADGLCRLLADTYTLYLKTHSFHWNVTGPMFHPLHQLFERQYKDLAESVDTIAERIRSLGFPAPGSSVEFSHLSSISESPGVENTEEMVFLLVEGNEAVVRTARTLIPITERTQDQSTLELLADRMRAHEKSAWMLRSLLESRKPSQYRAA